MKKGKRNHIALSHVFQSRAEQSRTYQSRAEKIEGTEEKHTFMTITFSRKEVKPSYPINHIP